MPPKKSRKPMGTAPTRSLVVDFDEIEWYTNLLPLCQGNRGGGEGEWAWGGPKGGNPTIYCSNLSVGAACVRRRPPWKIQVWGGASPHALTLLYRAKDVRKPETLLRPAKGEGGKIPNPVLAKMAELCAHKAGSLEAEWAVTKINGSPRAQFFTSILSSAGRLIYRNPGVLENPRLVYIEGEPNGFSAWVPAAYVRRPETLIRPAEEAEEEEVEGSEEEASDAEEEEEA